MKAIEERLSVVSARRLKRVLDRGAAPTRRVAVSFVTSILPAPALPPALPLSDVAIRVRTPQPQTVPTLGEQKRFPVATLDFSKKDVGLPYGVPRRITARTLKQLAGGRWTDQLLRKTSAGWEFVDDSAMIDLADNSVQFKLGRLTIFS